MKVSIKLGYNEAIAELSGAEVEVLHRILTKAQFVSNEYTKGSYHSVLLASPVDWEVKVLQGNAVTMSRESYNMSRAAEKIDNRAAMVKGIIESVKVGPLGEATSALDALRLQLYYDNFIKKSDDAKALSFEPLSVEHDVVDFFDKDGNVHRVDAFGTYEFFPVKAD